MSETIRSGRRSIAISSPEKVMFPKPGLTKLDLARYYLAVEESIMRTVRDRPTLLQRFPNGVAGSSFFQKRIPDSAPRWLQTTIVSTPNGTTSRALVLADIAHVVWAVNLACLGFHVWPNKHDQPDVADELRLDLDPQPGVDFDEIRAAAAELRRLLDELGIVGYPKTTGNRGLHVYVRLEPRWDSYQVRSAAVAAARELERRRPDLAASYQRAIVRALVERTEEAVRQTGLEKVAVVGGVAANSELRAALPESGAAPLELCTDNAAMIASAARYATPVPFPEYLALDAYATAA